MKVFKLEFIFIDQKFRTSGTYIKLFSTAELAIEYLNKEMPGVKESPKPEFIHTETSRSFNWVKERVDEDGDWDYPTEYSIELSEEEVIESLENV